MKTLSPLLLCLCAVLMAPPAIALADDDTSASPATSDTNTAQRAQFMKNAFAQLDLTPDQKQQIRQIRQTVTDKIQRHQEVMAVLTPEQKEKLRQLIQQYRSSNGGAAAATANTGDTGVGDGSDLAPGAN
ncbi:MAG: hypothetical protein LV481_03625 [Methylacidiphilales bacterium]|nr:hypothetical protein [Candidatus Methylacidiphilales bacterium]